MKSLWFAKQQGCCFHVLNLIRQVNVVWISDFFPKRLYRYNFK